MELCESYKSIRRKNHVLNLSWEHSAYGYVECRIHAIAEDARVANAGAVYCIHRKRLKALNIQATGVT